MSDKKDHKDHDAEAAWIRELAGILDETGLTEIEIEKDDFRLRVSRQGNVAAYAAPAPVAAASASAPAASAQSAASAPGPSHPGAVKSPMVGTAYLSPSPGADPFVREGSQVSEGQTLLIIEAMKTMNPIAAPRAGRIVKIIVADAQPVEYDEPLLVIE